MTGRCRRGLGLIVVVVLGLSGPATAQEADSISVTPDTDLAEGEEVRIVASTTAAPFGTVGLCPAESVADILAAEETGQLSIAQSECAALQCLHSGTLSQPVLDEVAKFCPVVDNGEEVSEIDIAVPLPRFTESGQDCAEADCVVIFATWNSSISVVGFVSAPITVSADKAPVPAPAPVAPAEPAPAPPPALALTGWESTWLLVSAAALLVSGAGAGLLSARRR